MIETYLDGSTVRSKEEPVVEKTIGDYAVESVAKANPFTVKDSGKREEFASGMVRDTTEGKVDYTRVLAGPMFDRWAEHLDKGAVKYPDVRPGVANWTLAEGEAEYQRFRKSALRHLLQWMRGDVDEDHAAAVFFNVNGAEYVKAKMAQPPRSDRGIRFFPGEPVTYVTNLVDPAVD